MAWLKLLLRDAEPSRIAETARAIAALKPSQTVLADAGRALLASNQNALAAELLTQAAAGGSPGSGIELDLAIATLRSGNAAKALEWLDRVPAAARQGDYHLAQAELLLSEGKPNEARAAIAEALRSAPKSPDFYFYATAFLTRSGLAPEAMSFLDQAARALPGRRDILLLRACALDSVAQTNEAEKQFSEIESRWPEWYPAWLAHAIVKKKHNQADDARRLFDTAKTLGAPPAKLELDLPAILEGALSRL